jgi:hypothetical protein
MLTRWSPPGRGGIGHHPDPTLIFFRGDSA